MSVTIRCILALTVFIWIIIDHTRLTEKARRKHDRELGCTCPDKFWGWVDPDCPVHHPFYTRYYKTLDNRVSCDRIYAKHGKRMPICKECLDETKPKGYIIQWPTEIARCNCCGKVTNTMSIPERDWEAWREINMSTAT